MNKAFWTDVEMFVVHLKLHLVWEAKCRQGGESKEVGE